MADSKKLFTAREAAQAVLKKAHEMLQNSDLMKSEKLKKDSALGSAINSSITQARGGQSGPVTPSPLPTAATQSIAGAFGKSEKLNKYETENKKPAGNRYGPIAKDQKPIERDYEEYEVKPGNSKDSTGPRLARQVSPSKNPKEEAEGNNKPDGMEPKYEFKDKIKGNLKKESEADLNKKELTTKGREHIKESNFALPGDRYPIHDIEHARNALARVSQFGNPREKAEVRAAVHKKYPSLKKEEENKLCKHCGDIHKSEDFNHLCAQLHGMGKTENPDKNADAELGEDVEHLVEDHFEENKEAEEKEGHKLMTKSDKKMEKHGLSPEQIKEKMKKAEMEKHGLSPEQIKEKMKKSEKKDKFERCMEDVKENSPGVDSPAAVCVAEGVKPKQQKSEKETEHAVIPRLIGSAKLSKFMEYRHAKKKAQMAAQAAGKEASNAPEQGSTQAGQPDESRPSVQPKKGDMDHA